MFWWSTPRCPQDVPEFVAWLKAQNGKASYASSGTGPSPHLSGAWFLQLTGTKAEHIPYRGAAPALQDLTAGVTQFFFDNLTSSIEFVRAGKLRALEPVSFPARDGLRLNGYLTRPENASGKLPLILVIHGGPYARDYWGFRSTHQWLANRGYAVLSVNYRGSTGYGKAFVNAAHHEWGEHMHDDLIDTANWAVGNGLADPKRVGFFGGSYGGYSALMAATRTPEVFACIVDLFEISNLLTFMATIPPHWHPWFNVWKNIVGNPDTEEGRAFLADRSPLNHLERATRPILIAHGLNDVRVVAANRGRWWTR